MHKYWLFLKENYRSAETFQMDVSNYYPMKELLREKYFDEGKITFSWFFYWYWFTFDAIPMKFSQWQRPLEIFTPWFRASPTSSESLQLRCCTTTSNFSPLVLFHLLKPVKNWFSRQNVPLGFCNASLIKRDSITQVLNIFQCTYVHIYHSWVNYASAQQRRRHTSLCSKIPFVLPPSGEFKCWCCWHWYFWYSSSSNLQSSFIWCRYDFHYDSLHKHLYNVFFLGSQPTGFSPKKPFNVIEKPCSGVDFPGATHCEEIPYMFDVSKYHSYNIKIWQCQVDINSYNIV